MRKPNYKSVLAKAFGVNLDEKNSYGGLWYQFAETPAAISFRVGHVNPTAKELVKLIKQLKLDDIRFESMSSEGGCPGNHNEYEYCECPPREHWIDVTCYLKRGSAKKVVSDA